MQRATDRLQIHFAPRVTQHAPQRSLISTSLRNVFADFEVSTQGRQFLLGREVAINLAPNGETIIEVPTEIVFAEVVKVVGPVASRILFGAKSIPAEAHIRFYGKPTVYNEVQEGALFSFSYDMNVKYDVQIPKEKVDGALDRIRDRLKRLP